MVSIVYVVVENALHALQQILETLTGAIGRNWEDVATWRGDDEGRDEERTR
jgi:hypothetical protein